MLVVGAGGCGVADVAIIGDNRQARSYHVHEPLAAQDLIVDDAGAVVGAVVRGDRIRETRIGARKVILATNGFGANRELLRSYCPEIAGALAARSRTCSPAAAPPRGSAGGPAAPATRRAAACSVPSASVGSPAAPPHARSRAGPDGPCRCFRHPRGGIRRTPLKRWSRSPASTRNPGETNDQGGKA